MNIYAVADIHGCADKVAAIRRNVLHYQPDVLIVAGDFVHRAAGATVLNALNTMPLPVWMVRGNSDTPKLDRMLGHYPQLRSLHMNPVRFRDIPFVGISGTLPLPFRNRLAWKERQLLNEIAPWVTRESVLVVHPPPWGVLDEMMGRLHTGSRGLRRLVQTRQPRLLICGHIHERPGVATLGNTTVVNCAMTKRYQGVLIQLGSKRSPKITWP